MSEQQTEPSGPDLTHGIALADLTDGKLVGHVGDQDVLVVRLEGEVFAVDARCTHYQGPLAEGLVVDHKIRCPWHHACFDLRTGEAVHAPALSPLTCWDVEERDGRIFVKEKRRSPAPRRKIAADAPARIVIVGGGAAG